MDQPDFYGLFLREYRINQNGHAAFKVAYYSNKMSLKQKWRRSAKRRRDCQSSPSALDPIIQTADTRMANVNDYAIVEGAVCVRVDK